MKKTILTHTLVALVAVSAHAVADKLYGGVVASSSAAVGNGSFQVLSATSIRFIINGTANYTDGGPATDIAFQATPCVTTGANLAAAWNAAPATCVPLWRTANGL